MTAAPAAANAGRRAPAAQADAATSGRLHATFTRLRAERRGGLSIYVCLGYPDIPQSEAIANACLDAGADWLELGIPFSDPAADGPAIQEATHAALAAGTRVAHCLDVARRLRARHPEAPLVAMTYANLAFRHGLEAFAADLSAAGIDGCILADVPLEEAGPVRDALAAAGVAWVPLVTPTTDAARMAAVAATATGFLYVVGNLGITGQDDPGPLVEATLRRARAADAAVPLCVGFGINDADDVRRVLAAGADAAIVGSRVVRAIAAGADAADVGRLVAALRRGTEPA